MGYNLFKVDPMPQETNTMSATTKSAVETFIDRANRLDALEHTDAALDLLYDAVDDLMRRREFDRLDELLHDTTTSDLSLNVLLGLLTATLPARSRLRSRAGFFQRVDETLRARDEWQEGLLVGLEG